jgi:hypothetical protein
LPKGLALIAVQLLCLAKRQDNGLAAMDLRRGHGHHHAQRNPDCRHPGLRWPKGKEPAVTAAPFDDPMVALLTDELYGLLTRECLVEGENLVLTRQDDRLLIQIMAISTGTLGVLLASLSDPAELDDPGSLTRRITPGEVRRRPDEWEYELVATRYPTDHGVVFLSKVRLPVCDLPEVVSRMRRNR